jgi:membrane-associated phospholipid phosphatase
MVDHDTFDARAGGRADPAVLRWAWTLAGVSAVVFGWLVYSIETGTSGVVSLDHHVTGLVVTHRSPVLNAMAKAVTFFGNEVTLSALTLTLVTTLLLRQAWRSAGFVVIAMAGSAALTVVGKHLVMRARPPVGDVVGAVLDRSYSFPSGHTLNSAVFVIALLCVVTPTASAGVARAFLLVVGCLLALGIGLSRVYLGFHWVSDVVGAWLIAAIWMTIVFTGLSAAMRRLPVMEEATSSRNLRQVDRGSGQHASGRTRSAHTPAAVTTASVANPARRPMSRP